MTKQGDKGNGGIVVSYVGVHQAYQLALAAQEIGELNSFYCGLYDAPGKWGGLVSKFIGSDALASRRINELNAAKVIEFPWPLIWKSIRDRFDRKAAYDWLSPYNSFDRWVAAKLDKVRPEIFVGTAAADLQSLKQAKSYGATLIHDCPGLHPQFIIEAMREAADRVGLRNKTWSFSLGEWDSRKLAEYSLADVLLVYSDIHRKSFEEAGYSKERLFTCPLWVDPKFWTVKSLPNVADSTPREPLKVLFVGSISLLKGVPFLLNAIEKCGSAVQLTIVGAQNAESARLLARAKDNVTVLPPRRKPQLAHIYRAHDVLALPSLADSFGFVAMEAMACGLPVIVTENCGVPVPGPGWRVPAMESECLAERIMQYADDRTLLREHGLTAISFASQFGPARYRQNIRRLYEHLLAQRARR